MKNCTDLEQSKKLAEILPLMSADMKILPSNKKEYRVVPVNDIAVWNRDDEVYCWSLTALLGVLPLIDLTTPQLIGTPKTLYRCQYNDDLKSHAYDNPIDACYEMIIKLHELKML